MKAVAFLFACLVCSSYGEEKLNDAQQPSQSLAMLLTAFSEPVAAWQSVGHSPRFQFTQSASPVQRHLPQTSMRVNDVDEVQVDRRSMLAKAIATVAISLPLSAAAASKELSVFEGVFTDPGNPGSYRKFVLSNEFIDGNQIAKLEASGGFDPRSFTAPALIKGNTITVDLSKIPGRKGPKEFTGKYIDGKGEEEGAEGIQFPGGGQYFWNRLYIDGEPLMTIPKE